MDTRELGKHDSGNHPLYDIIPKHRSQIEWYDAGHWITWALFGNEDDGIFGEESSKGKAENVTGAVKWWLRNPLHNFCFYVIGSADRKNSEFTLLAISGKGIKALSYQEEGGTNFPSMGTCFFLGFHGWKPFLSLRLAYTDTRRSDFYIGWRCRGDFGAKCILLSGESRKRIVCSGHDEKTL